MLNRGRILRAALLLAVACGIGAFFALGLQRSLDIQALQAHLLDLRALHDRHPVALPALYLLAYVLVAALAIPSALVMTLSGGAVFGLVQGVALASFGSSIGATLALLGSRYVFRDAVARRFHARLAHIDRGLADQGWLYLLSLRLVPAIPFFLVDLLFGVTAFPAARFYVVSQIGMFPATLVYVNAGTRIATLASPADILSPPLLGSLLLLAALPVMARLFISRLRPAP